MKLSPLSRLIHQHFVRLHPPSESIDVGVVGAENSSDKGESSLATDDLECSRVQGRVMGVSQTQTLSVTSQTGKLDTSSCDKLLSDLSQTEKNERKEPKVWFRSKL